MSDLGLFDDNEVLSTSIKVTRAGDGLSAALAVDPELLHMGDTVHVVLECTVADVTFRPIKDTAGVQRVHTLKAGTATMVRDDAEEDIQTLLTDQAERIQLANEATDGVARLIHKGPTQLQVEHDAGEHTLTVVGCPECTEDLEDLMGEPSDPTPIGGMPE